MNHPFLKKAKDILEAGGLYPGKRAWLYMVMAMPRRYSMSSLPPRKRSRTPRRLAPT